METMKKISEVATTGGRQNPDISINILKENVLLL